MKIVSGGQTGVDRAALDFAIESGIDYGGFVPKGRLSEDGKIPESYQNLVETETQNYDERTELNVIHSDATLIISFGKLTGGSLFTKEMAKKHAKPYLHIDLEKLSIEEAAEEVRQWLSSLQCEVLNVAGPRASSNPEIYGKAKALLKMVFEGNFRS
ncbi:MAG: putative molybdenum carrier protein [Pyrinomonadaceae bacterium]|nr:putative molybdenum carrier protein [Pyrinomonadaceae bacterium]MCX7639688.1 putative molybdenum carrier protein [Pyrinomonadaceae bacterium]MDW8304590.1 putative molybdenum carrier protein [Acidobacteriota bacterium]